MPSLNAPGALQVSMGEVSVRPYPWQMRRPAEKKNSSTSLERGAPPQEKKFFSPPTTPRTFESTRASAIRCRSARSSPTGLRSFRRYWTSLPIAIAHRNNARLAPDPFAARSSTAAQIFS